jgi:Uma2 family endonuclease
MVAVAYQPEEIYLTYADYLALEKSSGLRHEWLDGRVWAMAGASPNHNTLTMNLSGILYNQLRGRPCRPWAQDLRVRIAANNVLTYPDVLVSCPPPEWDEKLPHTLLNPRVVIEVLSPSTEAYDKQAKLEHYRLLPSLSDYILISQDRMMVQHFHRLENDDWLLHIAENSDEVLFLQAIDCSLPLSEIYERLDFTPPALSPDAISETT